MPADWLLNTVLELFQDVHDATKTDQIIGSTTHLLTTLSNQLNLGVLTSQFLTAPAIWRGADGLRTCVRIMGVYNTAAIRVRECELANARHRGPREGGGLSSEEWVRGVISGADERSSRWQHLLVLTGVLMGMEGDERRSLSRSSRSTLEHAVVMSANLALETPMQDGPTSAASIVLALSYAFPLLSDFYKSTVNCDAVLPTILGAIATAEGLREGDFLSAINLDLRQSGQQLHWPESSTSFGLLMSLREHPLVSNLGSVSKLASFAVQHAKATQVVLEAQDSLLQFSRRLFSQWRDNRFSGVDAADELAALSPETLHTTWQPLWLTLQSVLYSVVVILQAIVARSLLDRHMGGNAVAPAVAAKSLRILRNLFFISTRQGNSANQLYQFTYLASLDTISRYPDACRSLLEETLPTNHGAIPAHPLQRNLDLFHLNISEHLPLNISQEMCDILIVRPATAYLAHAEPHSRGMMELFESAHSAVLSVLACPHTSALTVSLVPFYIDKLFSSFPSLISTRQFRLAFRTVMQIVSPPYPVSATHPELSETLLEVIHFRCQTAGTMPLPPAHDAISQGEALTQPTERLSEQSSLVLTLIDSLPFLPLQLVEGWLALAAQSMNAIADPVLREPARKRFLEVLVSGEMDVERAAVGVCWWGTKGGREVVMGASRPEKAIMSGALVSSYGGSRL